MMQTPFRSSEMTVLPEWIDFNGHLNMAYYNVLFDRCADELYEELGFGPAYQKTGCTTYTAEFHLCYLRELHVHDRVHVTLQLIDYDEKRFHTYQEIWHVDGWCAATGEAMTLHVDQSGPRVAPMPANILQRLQAQHAAHAGLPRPERVGRSIGIRRCAGN
jgi:acyl-CoA thioester hydrolase